jgi:hypothetical protein
VKIKQEQIKIKTKNGSEPSEGSAILLHVLAPAVGVFYGVKGVNP